jgi:hypothetical protein
MIIPRGFAPRTPLQRRSRAPAARPAPLRWLARTARSPRPRQRLVITPRGFAPRTPLQRRSRAPAARPAPLRWLARTARSRRAFVCDRPGAELRAASLTRPSDSPPASRAGARGAARSAPLARSHRSLASRVWLRPTRCRASRLERPPPLGLPYSVARGRPRRGPLRSTGSLAPLARIARFVATNPVASFALRASCAPRTPLQRRSRAPAAQPAPLRWLARTARSHRAFDCDRLGAELRAPSLTRPSDSPPASLAGARCAARSAPLARSHCSPHRRIHDSVAASTRLSGGIDGRRHRKVYPTSDLRLRPFSGDLSLVAALVPHLRFRYLTDDGVVARLPDHVAAWVGESPLAHVDRKAEP